MNIIKGDLVKLFSMGTFDVIIHGCNCLNTMGAGIAKQIKERYPEAYQADLRTIKGDKTKLGTFTFAGHLKESKNNFIINAYTQYDYRGYKPVDYRAIESVFIKLNDWYVLKDKRIGIPKIGAGLAGGDWDVIKEIIDRVTPNLDITLVEWDGK